MKKILAVLTLLFGLNLSLFAQGGPGGDPNEMRQRMKERMKPELVEKTKINAEQADKVLDINFEASRLRRELRTDDKLEDAEKKKKMKAIDEDVLMKFKAIPLTEEEIKAVEGFFDERRKNAPSRREGRRDGK